MISTQEGCLELSVHCRLQVTVGAGGALLALLNQLRRQHLAEEHL